MKDEDGGPARDLQQQQQQQDEVVTQRRSHTKEKPYKEVVQRSRCLTKKSYEEGAVILQSRMKKEVLRRRKSYKGGSRTKEESYEGGVVRRRKSYKEAAALQRRSRTKKPLSYKKVVERGSCCLTKKSYKEEVVRRRSQVKKKFKRRSKSQEEAIILQRSRTKESYEEEAIILQRSRSKKESYKGGSRTKKKSYKEVVSEPLIIKPGEDKGARLPASLHLGRKSQVSAASAHQQLSRGDCVGGNMKGRNLNVSDTVSAEPRRIPPRTPGRLAAEAKLHQQLCSSGLQE
ncbi:hypothetical protein JOB18_013760 [Solea senegalensis]|uniref:Uncharacterized protein n=1 Tax=Solea senegalensis TaxID=28829 RepID=A0AAV6RGT7_SOLSE|nr:hypothetical protein JOB18_013760 [Solea senegalensis]